MTTSYKYKKCNLFGFSKSIENVYNYFNSKDNIQVYMDGDVLEDFTKEFIDEYNYKVMIGDNNIVTYVFDLTSDSFKDIIFHKKQTSDDSKEVLETNKEHRHSEQELNKVMTGQTEQLDAFSKNIYTVIYGKKTANIDNGNNNSHVFNHNVIDSLAKNGVIVDPITNKELYIHKILRNLSKLYKFNIFFIHPYLELDITVNESPTEMSHPSYIKNYGEITAVVYRSLILEFFPYLTITSESMRENAYLF